MLSFKYINMKPIMLRRMKVCYEIASTVTWGWHETLQLYITETYGKLKTEQCSCTLQKHIEIWTGTWPLH